MLRKYIGNADVQIHSFLTPVLNEGDWSTSRSGPPVPIEVETPEKVWAPGKEPRIVGPRARSIVAVTD
jgi:hypothetical protein